MDRLTIDDLARIAGCGRRRVYDLGGAESAPFGSRLHAVGVAIAARLGNAAGGSAAQWMSSAQDVVDEAISATTERRRSAGMFLAHPRESAVRLVVDAVRLVSDALVMVSNALHRPKRQSGRPLARPDRMRLLVDDGIDRPAIRGLVRRDAAYRFERLEWRSEAPWRMRLATLRRLGLAHVVVGDLATVLHGGAGVPDSLEICVAPHGEESRRIAALLVIWSARPAGVWDLGLPFIRDVRTVERASKLSLDCRGDLVEVIHEVPGVGDAVAASAAATILHLPEPVLVLQPEALLTAARAERSKRGERRRLVLAAIAHNRSRSRR